MCFHLICQIYLPSFVHVLLLKRLEVLLHDSNITQYSDEQGDHGAPNNLKLTHLHWHPGAYITLEELEDPVSILTFRNQCASKLRHLHLDVGKHSKSVLYSYSSNADDNDNNDGDIKTDADFFTKEEE